jgi:RHS repeat-associated protein
VRVAAPECSQIVGHAECAVGHPPTAQSGGNFTDTIAGMNVPADIDREGMYPYDFAQADVATTTYGYDAFGSRVLQTGTTTTYIYPNKFYSIASSTVSGAKYATTTEYVFNGDTLLSTVDQQLASGVATGSPQTRYIHPDHLGSTNVVTDQNGALVQTLDYYPYGATRISVATSTNEKRKFIGQFSDDSGLSYLNARFYNPTQGQFISQDPVFWEIGQTRDGQIALANPQALNRYAYANDNPIIGKDPSGRCPVCVPIVIAGGVGAIGGIGSQAFSDYLTGDFGQRSWQQNVSTYSVAAGKGTIVGAGVALAGAAAVGAGISAGLTTLVVGGTAGTLTAGTTVGGNYLLGQRTDPSGVIVDSSIAALSAGTLKSLPGVSGRLPNIGTTAFYTGAHTIRQGAEELFSNSIQSFGQTAYRSSPTYSTGYSGGGSRGSIVQQLQSLVSALQGLVANLSASGNKK